MITTMTRAAELLEARAAELLLSNTNADGTWNDDAEAREDHDEMLRVAGELRVMLATTPEQPAAIPGWKLVPVEATPEMLFRLLSPGESAAAEGFHVHHLWRFLEASGVVGRYRAMLAAAEDRPHSPTAGMNLGQRIEHVGGRITDVGLVEFGSVMAVGALVTQVLRDLPVRPAGVALLQRALSALEYHRDQTRPIAQTDAVIEELRAATATTGVPDAGA